MSAHLIGTHPTGSPEWHAARVGKMTGSRIAAAAGISPYESPFSLYYRMLGEIGEVEETPVMEWGNRLEDAVRKKFAENHPEFGVILTGVLQNDDRDWQVGSPDGLVLVFEDGVQVGGQRVLEVKTARYADEWGTEGTDQIPVHYRAQVLWYLDTLGLQTAHVAVLIGGSDYREYVVEYDEAEAIELRRIGREFLDRLEARRRPDVDADSATYQAIRELNPLIDAFTVDVPAVLAGRVIETKAELDAATNAHALVKAELADLMGNASAAYWDGRKIADRRARNGGTPYMQLARKVS